MPQIHLIPVAIFRMFDISTVFTFKGLCFSLFSFQQHNLMPSKNDRSFCFSGLAIVFCFLIWVLGCTGFSVYRKSSSCTLVNVYCISMKSFTHTHTLVPTISKTKTKTKTYQLSQKGSRCDCQACVKCVESISSHSPLPLRPLEAERHDG